MDEQREQERVIFKREQIMCKAEKARELFAELTMLIYIVI